MRFFVLALNKPAPLLMSVSLRAGLVHGSSVLIIDSDTLFADVAVTPILQTVTQDAVDIRVTSRIFANLTSLRLLC